MPKYGEQMVDVAAMEAALRADSTAVHEEAMSHETADKDFLIAQGVFDEAAIALGVALAKLNNLIVSGEVPYRTAIEAMGIAFGVESGNALKAIPGVDRLTFAAAFRRGQMASTSDADNRDARVVRDTEIPFVS